MSDCPQRWSSLAIAYAGSVLFCAGVGLLMSVSCGVCIGAGVRAYVWVAGD